MQFDGVRLPERQGRKGQAQGRRGRTGIACVGGKSLHKAEMRDVLHCTHLLISPYTILISSSPSTNENCAPWHRARLLAPTLTFTHMPTPTPTPTPTTDALIVGTTGRSTFFPSSFFSPPHPPLCRHRGLSRWGRSLVHQSSFSHNPRPTCPPALFFFTPCTEHTS